MFSGKLDKFGFVASFICAIHCFAFPIIISFFSIAQLGITVSSWFESIMILIAIIVGPVSLISGYLSHHGKKEPLLILIIGILLIVFGKLFHDLHLIIPFGGLLIAWAHLKNNSLSKSCLL